MGERRGGAGERGGGGGGGDGAEGAASGWPGGGALSNGGAASGGGTGAPPEPVFTGLFAMHVPPGFPLEVYRGQASRVAPPPQEDILPPGSPARPPAMTPGAPVLPEHSVTGDLRPSPGSARWIRRGC